MIELPSTLVRVSGYDVRELAPAGHTLTRAFDADGMAIVSCLAQQTHDSGTGVIFRCGPDSAAQLMLLPLEHEGRLQRAIGCLDFDTPPTPPLSITTARVFSPDTERGRFALIKGGKE